MNPAPASAEDYQQLRKERAEKLGPDLERLRAAGATAGYKAGDPDAVAAYYRIHFKQALARPEDVDKVVASLRASFTPEGVLKARRVEERLMNDTWLANGYNLLPKLASLHIPTLVIWGDHDFIPQDTSTHITRAIPGARMVTFQSCGHFSYLECPSDVRRALSDFFDRAR
jgi:proline iminopeptidase